MMWDEKRRHQKHVQDMVCLEHVLMFYFCEHSASAVSRRIQSSVTQCFVVAFFSDGDGVCDQQERDRRRQKNDRGMTSYDSTIYFYLFCYDLDMRLWVLDNVYLKDLDFIYPTKFYMSGRDCRNLRSNLRQEPGPVWPYPRR